MKNTLSTALAAILLALSLTPLASCGGDDADSQEMSPSSADDDTLDDDDSGDDDTLDDDTVDDDTDDDIDDDDSIDDDADDDTDDDSDDDSTDDDSTDDDTADDDTTAFEYNIKVDNMPMADVLANLDLFVDNDFILYLNVRPYDIGPDLTALLTAADQQGVPVKLWPLLASNDGSWGCEDDLDAFIANLWDTLDFVNDSPNNIDTIVLNMELGHPKIDQFKQDIADGDYAAALQLLLDNRNQALFAQNVVKMQQLVSDLHDAGYAVQVTTYPFILDDFADGDADVQDICDLPLQDVDFDRWAVTTYTTSWSEDLGLPLGPDFVYSYGKQLRDRFGDASELAIGIVQTADSTGYTSIDDFIADVAAAKAAGVSQIGVYHLPGILAQDDPSAWLAALVDTPAAQPPDEPVVRLMHATASFADWLLDFIP